MNFDRIWTLLSRKLAGETSPEELGELESLLKQNPDAHIKVQALVESWHQQDDPTPSDSDLAYQNLVNRLKDEGQMTTTEEYAYSFDETTVTRRHFRKKYFVTGVILIALLGTGAFVWLRKGGNQSSSALAVNPINTISTKYGSRTKIELPDGSVVWLNAGSKLTYDKEFGNSLREVNLTGEGFFDVVHIAEKPFIIHTSFFDIKDLGTQFNVKCYPEDKTTETSLVQGSVEITVKRRPNEKWILKPDEKLVLLNEHAGNHLKKDTALKTDHLSQEPIVAIRKLTYMQQDSFSVETAWTYNKLSFDDESFEEVAKKMARWYDCEFEFANKKLEDIHLNGSFISETLPEAMEALKYANRFNYEIKDRKVIIY
jgi:ferric-dicitrate binding protein FerR (iron transport regulator)